MLHQQSRSTAVLLHPTIAAADGAHDLPIIVHSHLRWDFVWQRPQQILARLAPHHRVAFIEEPIADAAPARVDVTEPTPGVVRIVPRLPSLAGLDVDAQCAQTMPLLSRAFSEHPLLGPRFERAIHWFYSPSVAPFFLGKFDAAAIVYDCMDELSKFRFAPADLPQREAKLLAAADVVFTGGYQLFTRKSKHHRNVHFYGCGVDADHYAKARDADTMVPADVASLRRPVLGYFGVIDERIDYDLLARLADELRNGSIVMIGPLAKVDRAALPSRPNLHWLGMRAYEDLPAYVKAFDVCLMPFALNEATENINPTKTLEYMAAGKPIVSTAVADVVRNFAPVVAIANSHNEFVGLVRRAADAPDAQMIARGIERARASTWESIVAAMHGHVVAAVRARSDASGTPLRRAERAVAR